MISAENISVKYGKKSILSGVNFQAKPREFTAIVGPNGSGKTTLLRALTGETAYGGAITLNGLDIAQTPPRELSAHRAVLSQSSVLSFPFQVIEVVRLGLQKGVEMSDDTVYHALEKVGLAGYGARLYQELSGGEQQRVQLARVLCQVWRPWVKGIARWLFLDEPVSSLDIGHQLMVMKIADDFAKGGGGVVAVMHDLNLSAMFADRIVLMSGGEILSQGPVSEVLTDSQISKAYNCEMRTCLPPATGGWFLLPQSAAEA